MNALLEQASAREATREAELKKLSDTIRTTSKSEAAKRKELSALRAQLKDGMKREAERTEALSEMKAELKLLPDENPSESDSSTPCPISWRSMRKSRGSVMLNWRHSEPSWLKKTPIQFVETNWRPFFRPNCLRHVHETKARAINSRVSGTSWKTVHGEKTSERASFKNSLDDWAKHPSGMPSAPLNWPL